MYRYNNALINGYKILVSHFPMQNTSRGRGTWASWYNTGQPPFNYTQALPYSVANRSMQNVTSAETYMANYVVGITNDSLVMMMMLMVVPNRDADGGCNQGRREGLWGPGQNIVLGALMTS